MVEAGRAPAADPREIRILGQGEILVIFEEPEAHEERSEHGLGQAEILEKPRASGAVFRKEIVQPAIECQHSVDVLVALPAILIQNKQIAGLREGAFLVDEHAFDSVFQRVGPAQRV